MTPSRRIDPDDLAIVREFTACPIGRHSPALEAALNVLRSGPVAGKYCLVCLRPHAQWALARLSGLRGVAPAIEPGVTYGSVEAGERDIFRRRWEAETGTSLPWAMPA